MSEASDRCSSLRATITAISKDPGPMDQTLTQVIQMLVRKSQEVELLSEYAAALEERVAELETQL